MVVELDTIDKILKLMSDKGVTQAQLTKEAGITNGLVTQWKNRLQQPSAKSLMKLSKYFDVPLDYFSENEQKNKPLVNNDEELTEYLEVLKTRPEMKMLFNLAAGATKEDVEKAVKIVEAYLKKD